MRPMFLPLLPPSVVLIHPEGVRQAGRTPVEGGHAVSDHLSSLRAVQDPVIDLTDLYFFPVPDVPGRLAVVLNLFPGAQPGTAFSDAVLYRIRLAPADIGPDAVGPDPGQDAVPFDVTFPYIEPD